jgi:hypothetical protein
VFSREIRAATFPQRFRQPTTIVKYCRCGIWSRH